MMLMKTTSSRLLKSVLVLFCFSYHLQSHVRKGSKNTFINLFWAPSISIRFWGMVLLDHDLLIKKRIYGDYSFAFPNRNLISWCRYITFMCVHLYNNAYVQQSMFKNVQLGCDGRSIGAHLHDSLSLCHFHSIPI